MTRNFKVVISNNFDNLAAEGCSATIEAEYGDKCVEGSILTLAHHGSRSDNPAPCVAEIDIGHRDAMDIAGWTFGVSHLDLDSIGGIAAVLGLDLGWEGFWKAAAWVDTRGPHRLDEFLSTASFMLGDSAELVKSQLHAYWAWSQANRVFAPRDGSVLDVTEQVKATFGVLEQIFAEDPALMELGRVWAAEEAELNKQSLFGFRKAGEHWVLVRVWDRFCNHLYAIADGLTADAVIALNTKFGSITVSRESDSVPLNCRKFVQSLWGEEAGGHDGIAGSPRNREMTTADLQTAADRLASLLETT